MVIVCMLSRYFLRHMNNGLSVKACLFHATTFLLWSFKISAICLEDFNNDGTLNHVFCAIISDIVNSGLSHTFPSVWKRLPETPTCGPMATIIAGSLFILGGDETCTRTATQERIHVYSPSSNTWVYVNDLPAP